MSPTPYHWSALHHRSPSISQPMPRPAEQPHPVGPRRQRLYEIIFKVDTPAGRRFDIALIVMILGSVGAVMIDSVAVYHRAFGGALYALEWAFTLAFTLEYLLRLACVRSPWRYARSFFGVVDLLSILPTYLSVLLPGANFLLVIRVLRILRVFRVFKLLRYLGEANYLLVALHASRRKIVVFLLTVATLAVVFGSVMYLVEGPQHGYTSIPRSVYWAIVTLTTVGYGDISPHTDLGQAIAAMVMILGYAIIAVPTGIYAAELAQVMSHKPDATRVCPACGLRGHDENAGFCKACGAELGPLTEP